ncbi:hypothetical protein DYB32_005269 [Aphanomyces invadans]|uniref:Uncharacterized protein n=1 Tax=Aphanomyces invadans TaxID=157072 RepID=A0A3R6VL56_9STRA|nr:hypothetical protein DYB32_005269 [Aphanomyces invadans]
MTTLRAKILSFKQRPIANDATPVSPIGVLPTTNNGDMSVPASPQVKLDTSLMEVDIIPFSEQLQQPTQPAQMPQLIKNQYNETHQCCQTQLAQQSQLSASHVQQNTPMAARQLQMTMLQLQHDMARNNLMQHHMSQQNNLIQHHYQQLLALANQEISI